MEGEVPLVTCNQACTQCFPRKDCTPPLLPFSLLSSPLSLYSDDEIMVYLHGSQLTTQYFEKHGFTRPVIIKKKDGLGLKVPSGDFLVSDVEKYVGKNCRYARTTTMYMCDDRCIMITLRVENVHTLSLHIILVDTRACR